MAISSSLYSSISGLSTMGEAMSVLGDNVANVNTVSFKASRSTFQDVLSQSVSTASGAAEVGRGVTLSAINSLFAQGSFESSSSPTDMAIGGQGFFMLRAADSAEADMYTRAGEFGFDQTGNLVNQMNHFVQGWTIDTATGERQGAITDINIGKNTPPVATQSVEVIANLDSRKTNETNEDRLYANWNGTNAASIPPTDPIDANKYEYTTAIKIYDSKGASHDLSVYFDRTTNDNQWEFLVTCDPTEDQRVLTEAEKIIYNPDTVYNYINHKGAGALMYGTIQFDTSGNISQVDAYSVPPDGHVDPSKPENRMLLDSSTSYFSIPTNFNGDTTNQMITLNMGARYEGRTDTIRQILVSDAGARALATGGDVSSFITSATPWSRVADTNGNTIVQGDMFIFEGYSNGSDPVPRLVYTVDPDNDIQDLLTQLETTFKCSASVDAQGRLRLSDSTQGDSSMFVTRFETISSKGATPFGGSQTVPNAYAISDDGILNASGSVVTTTTTSMAGLMGLDGDGVAGYLEQIATGDTFIFEGVDVDGTAIAAAAGTTFTVDDPNMATIDDLLGFIETTFGGINSNVHAVLDADGKIRVVDTAQSGLLDVKVTYNNISEAAGSSDPFGMVDETLTTLTPTSSVEGQINVTTSKKMVIANGRGFTTDTGDTNPLVATTQWGGVYDDNVDPAINSGNPRQVRVGDIFRFDGLKSDGSAASTTYEVINSTDTIQDMLDQLEDDFDCQASMDTAGRLVLTDWVADTVTLTSSLSIASVTYTYPGNLGVGPWPDTSPDIFGPGLVYNGPAPAVLDATSSAVAFDEIPPDISSEDGSQFGDIVTSNFSAEALSTTQYANSSTTIFQDQDGFASGFLQSVSTDVDGVITGHYSNGQVLKKAQVALANFSNLAGLSKRGGNIFVESTESGAPVTGPPGTNGLGSIAPNALEQSNVDLGVEFVKLITVQRGFQANSKIITTTDDMLNELINIKR